MACGWSPRPTGDEPAPMADAARALLVAIPVAGHGGGHGLDSPRCNKGSVIRQVEDFGRLRRAEVAGYAISSGLYHKASPWV